MARLINDLAVELIKSFEQCRLKSYQGAADVTGTFTVGYGHVITGHEIDTHGVELFKAGNTIRDVAITQEIADRLLLRDLEIASKAITLNVPKDIVEQLTDDQFGALTSFIFNVGGGWFSRKRDPSMQSRIYKTLCTGDIDGAGKFFRGFIKSNGDIQSGLVRRRAAEKALYYSDYNNLDYFQNNYNSVVLSKAKQYLGLV